MRDKLMLPALAGERGRVTWHKHAGDDVKAGEVVLDIDLEFMKVPVHAPSDGKLGKLAVNDGTETSGNTAGAMFEAAPEPIHDAWGCIECTFKCRACAFMVPIDELAFDGAVVCARCGLEQAFAQRLWHLVLDFAHGAADRAIAGSRVVLDEETRLTVFARGGAPECPTCKSALAITTAGERTTASCSKCETSVEYVVPAAAIRMSKAALRGVIADAHRANAAVKVDQTASAVAIQCPSCSASLDVPDDAKVVVCKFCKTTSRIPSRVLFKLKGGDAKPSPIWLEFRGASHARRDELRQKEQAEHDARIASIESAARAHRASLVRRREEERDRKKATSEAAEERAEASRDVERLERVAAEEKRGSNRGVIILIGVVLIAAAAVLGYSLSR